jgi:hypothetical protein
MEDVINVVTDPPLKSSKTSVKKTKSSKVTMTEKSTDNEPADKAEQPADPKKDDDFWGLLSGIFTSIPWKVAIFLYIIFLLVNTAVFLEYVIEPIGNTFVDGGNLTDKGIALQGLFFVIAYIVVDMLGRSNIL